MKKLFDEGRLDKKWIERYCKDDWESCVRYRMEENGESHPDNMMPERSSLQIFIPAGGYANYKYPTIGVPFSKNNMMT